MKKHFKLLLLLAAMIATTAMAQVSKVPADTRMYLQAIEAVNQKAKIRSTDAAVRQQEAKLFVSCAPTADTKAVETQLKALGAKPQGTIGRYIMVSTPARLVSQIADIEGVTFISKGPDVSQKTNISKAVTGVTKIHAGSDGLPQAFTGKDVVVGVIDGGFDLAHPAYKDAEGNLRIKALYGASMSPEEGHAVVTLDGTELGGREYTTPEAILALKTDESTNSHGSHCAATAAGSTFEWAGGMAPEADIIICPLGMTDKPELESSASIDAASYGIMNSILYIRDYAKRVGKPYIVSMSMNSQEGTHDGSSVISSMMEKLAAEGTNMALASSNEGDYNCYLPYTFGADDAVNTFITGGLAAYGFTRTPAEMKFQLGFFDAASNDETWLSEVMSSAGEGCSFNFTLGDGTTPEKYADIKAFLEGVIEGGQVVFSLSQLEDGRAHLSMKGSLPDTGKGYLVFHVSCPKGTVADFWGDNGCAFNKPEGDNIYSGGDSSLSAGDWGTGGSIITVGSWVTKNEFTTIKGNTREGREIEVGEGIGSFSPFSSYGTDLAGHDHPYVSTPGSMITSAANHFDAEYDPETSTDVTYQDANGFIWAAMSGTSMATPTAAGIIALWLQAKPTLTYEEIKETIRLTSNRDEFTDATPIRFGYGKMDAYKGLLHVLDIPTAIPELSTHQPAGVTFSMKSGVLYIDGAADGTPIRIYTTDGRLVTSTALSGGSITLPDPTPAGVYAVQVGTLGSTLIRK